MMTAPPPYLTPREVAAELAVHPRTVQRWISSGRLPFRRIGGRLRVHREWLSMVDSGDSEPVGAMVQTAPATTDPSTNPNAAEPADSREYSR